MAPTLAVIAAIYVLGACGWVISQNRRPLATIAWIFAIISLPGFALIPFVLFGRTRKGFRKERKLMTQELEPEIRPVLAPILASQDADIAELQKLGPSHRRLLGLVRGNSHSALTRRNEVRIQQDARTFYPSLVEDMKAARHSIHHQYFIWESDEVTDALADVMCAKASEGVQVRLLYDPIGARPDRRYRRRLRDAGVHIAPTSPRYRVHTISYRNHRKITVIDGEVGFVGGMNIGKEHVVPGEGFAKWRDTQLRIAGDGAAILQAVFMTDWFNATGEELFEPVYFTGARHSVSADGGGVPLQILTSGPDSDWAAIRQLYVSMIMSAQRHVRLTSPYFVLDATVAEALTSAALAGVDVKVMLSARPQGHRLPHWAGTTFMADVSRAGVKIHLYDGGYLHAKTLSIDSEICTIGSANLDIRSFSLNYEVNAVLYDARLAAALEADFERDLSSCRPFDPAAYKRASRILRFRDSVARLFSPLL